MRPVLCDIHVLSLTPQKAMDASTERSASSDVEHEGLAPHATAALQLKHPDSCRRFWSLGALRTTAASRRAIRMCLIATTSSCAAMVTRPTVRG